MSAYWALGWGLNPTACKLVNALPSQGAGNRFQGCRGGTLFKMFMAIAAVGLERVLPRRGNAIHGIAQSRAHALVHYAYVALCPTPQNLDFCGCLYPSIKLIQLDRYIHQNKDPIGWRR